MSVSYDFSKAKTLVGEHSLLIRQGVRNTLLGIGFRDVADTASVVKVYQTIKETKVDLIVLNKEMEKNDTSFLVKEIRLGKVGADPFAAIIAVLTDTDEYTVRTAIDSGVDDLLVVPFAPDQLIKRVLGLVARRKPFVVTHDYIGPERRLAPRTNASSATQFAVPNPLAHGAKGLSEGRYHADVLAARELVFAERVKRLAAHTEWEAKGLLDVVRLGPPPDDMGPRLYKLEQVAEELLMRLGKGVQNAAVEGLAAKAKAMRGAPQAIPIGELEQLLALAKTVARTYAAAH